MSGLQTRSGAAERTKRMLIELLVTLVGVGDRAGGDVGHAAGFEAGAEAGHRGGVVEGGGFGHGQNPFEYADTSVGLV